MLKEEDKKLIHKNNLKRVIRTLELYRNIKFSKKEYMDIEKERIKNLNNKYDFLLFYIDIDKNILNDRINKRVDLMFDNGLETEARYVYSLKDCTCKQSIGYKEFFDYFEGKKNIEQVREEIKLRTRQYAKRQRTWFKNMKDIITLSGTNEEIIELMVNYYDKKNKR
jgi:tRNA dimethylallyltransferase